MQDIYEFVQRTLAQNCKIDPRDITPTTNLFADLGIDSVDFLAAAYEIEDHYGIRLPVGDWMSDVNAGETPAVDYFRMDNFVAAIAEFIGDSQVLPTGGSRRST